jgi:hypothetical protein
VIDCRTAKKPGAYFMPRSASRPARIGRRRAAITLEWVLLVTVLIIGTVGGVAAVRNALILEYQEMIETICEMSVSD